MFNIKFDVRYANPPDDSRRYDTEELRRHYHISNLFEKDSINLTYSHQDRIIAGGIMPVEEDLVLESCKELAEGRRPGHRGNRGHRYTGKQAGLNP